MDEIETLGILDEIQSIVSDKLQVVSYKWLSRNFLVSSNAAKSLLREFVEKYGNGLEVIYSVSCWLKNDHSTYHVRLVSKHMLSAAEEAQICARKAVEYGSSDEDGQDFKLKRDGVSSRKRRVAFDELRYLTKN